VEQTHLEQIGHISTLTTMIYRKSSFQKRTQYKQGNNVLDAPASNTDGCLGEKHVFLHLSWIGQIRANRAYLQLEKPTLQEVFL
jgi:hypothetical protein